MHTQRSNTGSTLLVFSSLLSLLLASCGGSPRSGGEDSGTAAGSTTSSSGGSDGSGGTAGCEKDCGEPSPVCGNAKIEGTEECDDGNAEDGDACSSSCKLVETPCEVGDPCFELPWVHQDGALWKDETGKRVELRGTNLGNWLILEFWMMNQAMKLGNTSIDDQCTLESALEERFGFDEKERLMGVFRDNWIKSRDFDLLASLGFNVVRLPFHHGLVEDVQNPMTLRSDAWKYLDFAIEEAEKRGMYVILDLHGAAGSQGWEHHSGCAGKNELWGSTANRERTKWIWRELAKRYEDRSAVVGYGLLNEPWGTDADTLAAFSKELYDEIRPLDDKHIVILPGHNTGGIDAYGDPASQGMKNVALEMHFYPGFWGWRENDDPVAVHSDWLHCSIQGTGETCAWDEKIRSLKTPFLVGEFQPWTELAGAGGLMTRKTHDIYGEYGWAGTSWAYKTVSFGGSNGNPESGWGWGVVSNASNGGTFGAIDIESASKEAIETHFKGFGTQALVTHPGIAEWMNYRARIGEKIEAEVFLRRDGVRMEATTDIGGGFNCSNINPNDSMTYSIEVPKAGTYALSFRVATTTASELSFLADGEEVKVSIPSTGGWQTWTTLTSEITLGAGRQDVTIRSNSGEWNLNWFRIDPT